MIDISLWKVFSTEMRALFMNFMCIIIAVWLYCAHHICWNHGPWRSQKKECWWKSAWLLLLRQISENFHFYRLFYRTQLSSISVVRILILYFGNYTLCFVYDVWYYELLCFPSIIVLCHCHRTIERVFLFGSFS